MNQRNEYITTMQKFVKSAIIATKKNEIRWSVDTDAYAIDNSFVTPTSFCAKYQTPEMYLQKDGTDYRFAVRFSSDTPIIVVTDYSDDEIATSVVRLFNIVYEKVPKATDYMLNFIKKFGNEDESDM